MKCPKGCKRGIGIKRKNLTEHAEICPLEEVRCPFYDAGCEALILREALDAHLETSTQQHLMKVMTAYSKLKLEHDNLKTEHSKLREDHQQSMKMVSLAFAKPIKLTEENNTFTFILSSSEGWVSPIFYILGKYKMCIKYKEQERACLLLLKGEHDDNLEWPINLTYELIVGYVNTNQPISKSVIGKAWRAMTQEFHFNLCGNSSDLSRVTLDESSRELSEIRLPKFDENIIYMNVTLMYHVGVAERLPRSNKASVQAEMSSTLEAAQGSFRTHCPRCHLGFGVKKLSFCPFCGARVN